MADLDQQLLAALRRDGRRSVSDLAAELSVSRATVRARMDRLERTGAVVGYTVVLRAEATATPVRGLTMIEVEGRNADKVVAQLGGFPEIAAVHSTNGKWDLIAEIGTDTLADFDAVLRRIRLVPGITASETNLLLATQRTSRARS